VQLPVGEWGLEGGFQAHDLLSEQRFFWSGEFNYVELNPATSPAHIIHVKRRVRDGSGFEYFA